MLNIIITFYSIVNGIEPSVAFQMARVESNMNFNAVSRTGDGGLFQLNKRYYKFHNNQWMFDPSINTSLAMKLLGDLKLKCKHKLNNSYIVCYNMGERGASKIKNPENQSYYKKFFLLRKQ